MELLDALDPRVLAAIISALVSAVVAIILAVINPLTQRRIERAKNDFQEELEKTKAALAKEASYSDARTAYEFDARKRLYDEIEPLFFQLFEAAEGSYYRVASLVRTERQGNLGKAHASWLGQDGYYLRSTVYRIFLPLVIYRLIQRSATFIDLRLDDKAHTRYFLLKSSYYALTDDFLLANTPPKLEYHINNPDWRKLCEKEPAIYCRQGLVIGHLDRLIDSLIISDGKVKRPMSYGEFEDNYETNKAFQKAISRPKNLFLGFSFPERPVLARILIAHAYVMRLLLLSFSRSVGVPDLVTSLNKFRQSEEAHKDLAWDETQYGDISSSVYNYVVKRLDWIAPEDYDVK